MICDRIGQGKTADVYLLDEDRMIKLFHSRISSDWVDHELKTHQMAEKLSLPVPRLYGKRMAEGRTGLVYERIHGSTLTREMIGRPEQAEELAQRLASLHLEVHQRDGAGLPSMKGRLRRDIRRADQLSAETRGLILRRLDRLPEGDRMCHGDFHPDNILISSRGMLIIDWMTGSRGHPLADVARTALIFRHASLPPGTGLEELRDRFGRVYLETYFRLSGQVPQDLDPWMLPLAAARLVESILEEEKDRLISLIGKWVTEIG